MNTRIVLGITGGIAAYKTPHLIRLLCKKGASVKVVLTRHAMSFTGSEALRTVSGAPLYHDDSTDYDIGHIRLTQWADLLVVAPATANTIAKIAHGIADNLLTSTTLAFSPHNTIIVPAMNTGMWNNEATRTNIATLKARGITVLPVGTGALACGDDGEGRMIEPEEIAAAIEARESAGRPLSGKTVLISSGPTEEPIDPVRVITNRSSGKMGAALAAEALAMGASVTVVSGPAIAPLPQGAKVIAVRTAEEMSTALHDNFSTADICIMAAAVSDYRPVTVATDKIHRDTTGTLTIACTPNSDILASLGNSKKQQVLVGFALESSDNEARAREKMARKKCDLMVFNLVNTSLGTNDTAITIYSTSGTPCRSGSVTKTAAAKLILECAVAQMDRGHE